MKFSVSTYSYSQYIQQGKMTQLDCIAKAKEMGFDAIDFTDVITPDKSQSLEQQIITAKELRAEADRVGMEIYAYTIGACLYQDTPAALDAAAGRCPYPGCQRYAPRCLLPAGQNRQFPQL